MYKNLTFIVPVRHPKNAKDWNKVKQNLAQTIRSISGQDCGDWRAIIVANRGSDIPYLPPKFEVNYVDFPPNLLFEQGSQNIEVFRDAVRFDKGRRLLSGILYANNNPDLTGYIMTVDDDDLVSCRLASFVNQNSGSNGWYIASGYFWESGGNLLYKSQNFSKICGTSHIVRTDLLHLPESIEAATDIYIRKMLGSHIFIQDTLKSQGKPLELLPFPGAIYRINHSESHSKSSGLLRKVFLKRGAIKRPLKTLDDLLRVRILNSSIKQEFWGR